MIVEIFKPLDFKNAPLNLRELNEETGNSWQYASSGKAALYHCLKSLNVQGTVLIPVYICSSVLKPISDLKLNYICYDINTEDLNVDIEDLKQKIKYNKISCVLVASMYGNPANMEEVEGICKKNNILLIDDAAQSFGSKLNNKHIGTFGDAGFFSFSPGKATPGHLGAFFWTKNKEYSFKRTNNYLLHKLAYWNYYFNRSNVYNSNKVFRILKYVCYVLFRVFDLKNDKINEFEKSILGGILLTNKTQVFRSKILQRLKEINFPPNIVLLTLGNQESNNHKIVLKCCDIKLAYTIRDGLLRKKIYAAFGYKLLNDGIGCPNAKTIDFKIIELPLEENDFRMNYLIETLKNIIKE